MSVKMYICAQSEHTILSPEGIRLPVYTFLSNYEFVKHLNIKIRDYFSDMLFPLYTTGEEITLFSSHLLITFTFKYNIKIGFRNICKYVFRETS